MEAPAEFDQLDLSVRRQFAELWSPASGAVPVGDGSSLGDPVPVGERQNWGELGRWFHAYRYPHNAAICYRNALRLDPAEPQWHYYLGDLAAGDGRFDEARRHFLNARARAPDALHVLDRLADLAREGGDAEQAESLYRQVLDRDPADPVARFGMGQLELQRGEARAALDWLEPLHNEQPRASELLFALATAWRVLGDSAKANDLFKRIPADNVEQMVLWRRDPWLELLNRVDQGSRALTRQGVRANSEGRYAQAAVLFGAAVQRDPAGPEERINYALALGRIGRLDDALAQFDRAIELAAPGSSMQIKARLERARLLVRSRRFGEAESALRTLAAEQPGESGVHFELARVLHTRGDLEGAVAEYRALRALGESAPDLLFWHAAALIALGRNEDAAIQLEADMERTRTTGMLLLLLGRATAQSAQDDPPRLRATRERIAAAGLPPSVAHAETMAMLDAALADHASARRWQQQAVDALARGNSAGPLRIARRRLALYGENKMPLTGWEARERPLAIAAHARPARADADPDTIPN